MGASLVDIIDGALVAVRVVYTSGGAKSGLIQIDATGCDVGVRYSKSEIEMLDITYKQIFTNHEYCNI